jgi:hypothetical protein
VPGFVGGVQAGGLRSAGTTACKRLTACCAPARWHSDHLFIVVCVCIAHEDLYACMVPHLWQGYCFFAVACKRTCAHYCTGSVGSRDWSRSASCFSTAGAAHSRVTAVELSSAVRYKRSHELEVHRAAALPRGMHRLVCSAATCQCDVYNCFVDSPLVIVVSPISVRF